MSNVNAVTPIDKEAIPANIPIIKPAKETVDHTPALTDGEPQGEVSETSAIAEKTDPHLA